MQHGFYAEAFGTPSNFVNAGSPWYNLRSSNIVRFVQGGVVKTFRCRTLAPSMHNPHCDVRDSNHKYSLSSHEEYGWWTGTVPDGRQIFAYGWMLIFTREGKLWSIDLSHANEIWTPADAPTFRDQNFLRRTIHVERFSIPQIPAYIQDLPDTCGEFLENPSRFSAEERDQYPSIIDEWIVDGQFVLGLPGNDFYLASDGSVETS